MNTWTTYLSDYDKLRGATAPLFIRLYKMEKIILVSTDWFEDNIDGPPRDVFSMAVGLVETTLKRKYDLMVAYDLDTLIKIPRLNILTSQLLSQIQPHIPYGQIDQLQLLPGKRVNGGFEVILKVTQYD